MRLRRISTFLLLGLGFLFVVPNFVNAQVDQRCWEKDDCNLRRSALLGVEDKEGLYTGSDAKKACGVGATGKNAAGKEIGFCLPISQSNTKIAFGGKQSFANFGDFIQYIYRYGMWLAGIIAVAFIVVSGAQWAASGGNADMISSAKTRISGAITGLVLLSLSYVLLSNINPYLVTLRLPQVWLINEIGLAPPYCNDVKEKKVALVGPISTPAADKETKRQEALKKAEDVGYTLAAPTAICGNDYIVEDTGGQMCMGKSCGDNMFCGPVVKDQKQTSGKQCYQGDLGVKFTVDLAEQFYTKLPFVGLVSNQLEDGDWIDDNDSAKVFGICGKPKGDGICVSDQTVSVKVTGWKLKGEVLPAYYTIYHGLRTTKPSDLCKQTGIAVGFMVKEEVAKNWNATDPNIYWAIPASGNEAYFGDFLSVYNQIKEANSDLAYQKFVKEGGLELNAFLSSYIFSKIDKKEWSHRGSVPYEDRCENYTSEGEVKPEPLPASGGFCFLAGTKILTPAGEKLIENITPGEVVVAYDETKNSFHVSRVSKVDVREREGYYIINQGLLRVTDQHPIFARSKDGTSGWASMSPAETLRVTDFKTKKLIIGDQVFTKDQKWVTITDIVYIQQPVPTYNLINVSPVNTYFANDILVHNKE